jgi:hypothetical protein
MVTNPNLHHPITLTKDPTTPHQTPHRRITPGIGAGTEGFDTTVPANPPSSHEQAERFDDLAPLPSTPLEHDATTSVGSYYSAVEARNIPGCIQHLSLASSDNGE